MMNEFYYYAGKPTGKIRTIRAEGKQETSEVCGHKHDSVEAASKCADQQSGSDYWGVYRSSNI